MRSVWVVCVLGLSCLLPGTGLADVTVVSVAGRAWQRPLPSAEWAPLHPGDHVRDDGWVRVGADSTVRLIDAAGRIQRLAENEVRRLGDAAPAQGTAAPGRLFAVLSEVFSTGKQARIAASRAGLEQTGAPSQATQNRLEEVYHATWLELMAKDALTREDLELAFDTAAWYADRPRQNRALGLLLRLQAGLPQDAGLRAMASQALAGFGQPASLRVTGKQGEATAPLASGATLRSGDGLQLHFASETESFVYVVLHTRAAASDTTTSSLIFPPANVPRWPVAAGEPLVLPMPGSYYVLDDTVGVETLAVWNCVSWLTADELRTILRYREDDAPARSPGQASGPAGSLPAPVCPQRFVTTLVHK